MYPVSNAFLNAVKANTRKYYWTGKITTTAGTVYEFDQDDMVKGSGYITSQSCGSTDIELGTVYQERTWDGLRQGVVYPNSAKGRLHDFFRLEKCAACMKVRMQKCKMTCYFVIKNV